MAEVSESKQESTPMGNGTTSGTEQSSSQQEQGQGSNNPTSQWSEHSAPDGRKYYYNDATGESTWERYGINGKGTCSMFDDDRPRELGTPQQAPAPHGGGGMAQPGVQGFPQQQQQQQQQQYPMGKSSGFLVWISSDCLL